MTTNTLEELAIKYGTDKQMSCHGYTEFYFKHFNPIKDENLKILEIGVHKGYSLEMWADYFTNSTIYGIDDGSSGDLKEVYDNPRIQFRKGQQYDTQFLGSLIAEVVKFDIIIDDGSHYSTDIITSMNYLFDHATKWYVIEDLQTSYPPYTNPGLKERFNREGPTATQYMYNIESNMHIGNFPQIKGVYTYKEISFIEKR